MPRFKSKAQQRFAFGVLVPSGKMSKTAAKKRALRGKNFKKAPSRLSKTRTRYFPKKRSARRK